MAKEKDEWNWENFEEKMREHEFYDAIEKMNETVAKMFDEIDESDVIFAAIFSIAETAMSASMRLSDTPRITAYGILEETKNYLRDYPIDQGDAVDDPEEGTDRSE